MEPKRLLKTAIMPALDELATMGIPSSPSAARFLLAIALQESGIAHRRQVGTGGVEIGPAVSYWQFELNGGCRGVLRHPSTAERMSNLCTEFNVQVMPGALWEAIRYQDILAAAAARLLIFTLPKALPDHADDGWEQYLSAWRPGKPKSATWADNWALATETVGC